MKQKTFNKLAKKAGFCFWTDESWKPEGATIDWSCDYTEELKKFAKLIIEHERDRSCYKDPRLTSESIF